MVLEEGVLVLLLILVVVVVTILPLLELRTIHLEVGDVTTLKAGSIVTPPPILAVVVEADELLHNKGKILIICFSVIETRDDKANPLDKVLTQEISPIDWLPLLGSKTNTML